MQRYTVYLYPKTAVHVSGGTSTHHQERVQLHLQHLVFVTPSLLPAGVVEELELQHLVFVTPLLLTATIVEEFQLFHDSGR